MTLNVLTNKSNSFLLNKKIYAFFKGFSVNDLHNLHKEELELWENKKKFLRNGENWVVGRVTAKYSIIQCIGLKSEDITNINIKNRQNGAPFCPNLDKKIKFSIAHCKGIGFSCSSSEFDTIGCDIEKVRVRHYKFPNYFLCKPEKELWIRENRNEDLHTLFTIAWSCKEACYKCLSSAGYFIETVFDIRIQTVLFEKGLFSFSFKGKKGIGYWDKHLDFVLSIAVTI
ncbi:4'-phosphopantetheinyl transferase family protein [Neobacillus soli]|uniref:4'-phosphopantetheinyl transferase family protein n=1 Tax=Neobacillus soli TaxID=220688 RepID=UPI0008252534|nr:4'-phosphopantetheinyl transferase superfamily protein [Neobacillus soli]